MRGRKPKPTSLKLLEGNPGKRPLNHNEPQPTPKAPGCPTWLSPEAKAEWRRVVPELDRLGLLSRVDRAALAAYCEAWSTFVAAERAIQTHGLVLLQVESELDDGRKLVARAGKNPAVLIARDASASIRAFCTEFGLTPSARSRMTLPGDKDEDLDTILARRRAERAAARKPGG